MKLTVDSQHWLQTIEAFNKNGQWIIIPKFHFKCDTRMAKLIQWKFHDEKLNQDANNGLFILVVR